MLHSLKAQLGAVLAPALAERLTLVFNHVLAAETAATERLKPHRGRSLQLLLQGWPSLLPPPPRLAWRITPAGLLEWLGPEGGAGAAEPGAIEPPTDLTVRLDASNPALLAARTLAGETPTLQIDGDAQLAGDVNWLAQNLRWDVEADLERLFGPAVAHQLHRLGSGLAAGLRRAARGAAGWRDRFGARGG